MAETILFARNLSKTYRVAQRDAGLVQTARALLRPVYHDVPAVQDVSFSIEAGEMVGFIGPNGAGKTTTLKMLAGLLQPSGGEARVAGHVPWQRQHDFLRRISMVLGNKSQMIWDLPPMDTFRVLADIYGLSEAQYRSRLDELVALLEMEEVLKKPVRNLSLGERMKCELISGLLHAPAVLFLDEPTLGLDVSSQNRLRRFLQEYNRRSGATIMLTSHYMADVTALCRRVILIHHGGLLYDGELNGLAQRLAPYKLLRFSLAQGSTLEQHGVELPDAAVLLENEQGSLTLRVERSETPAVTSFLLNSLPVSDLTVEDAPIEAVIDRIYREETI